MTAFGDQHSIVIGTAGGSLIKCNADAWSVAGKGGEGHDGKDVAGESSACCVCGDEAEIYMV